MPISDELAAVYGSAPTYDHYIECLSLRHKGFSNRGVIHVTSHLQGWSAYLEDGTSFVNFRFLPFVAIPPKEEETAALTLQVGIDNVSRVIMDELESAAGYPDQPITCTYRVYLASDNTTVQNAPPLKLYISGVVATADNVSFSASIVNLRRQAFPRVLYTTEQFPGLKR
jgi:hypothetical protein